MVHNKVWVRVREVSVKTNLCMRSQRASACNGNAHPQPLTAMVEPQEPVGWRSLCAWRHWWSEPDVKCLAESLFEAVAPDRRQLVLAGKGNGSFIVAHKKGPSCTASVVANAVALERLLRLYPARVPSAFFLADVLFCLHSRFFHNFLLRPSQAGDPVEKECLRQGHFWKKVVQHLRHVRRNNPGSKNAVVNHLKAMVVFTSGESSDALEDPDSSTSEGFEELVEMRPKPEGFEEQQELCPKPVARCLDCNAVLRSWREPCLCKPFGACATCGQVLYNETDPCDCVDQEGDDNRAAIAETMKLLGLDSEQEDVLTVKDPCDSEELWEFCFPTEPPTGPAAAEDACTTSASHYEETLRLLGLAAPVESPPLQPEFMATPSKVTSAAVQTPAKLGNPSQEGRLKASLPELCVPRGVCAGLAILAQAKVPPVHSTDQWALKASLKKRREAVKAAKKKKPKTKAKAGAQAKVRKASFGKRKRHPIEPSPAAEVPELMSGMLPPPKEMPAEALPSVERKGKKNYTIKCVISGAKIEVQLESRLFRIMCVSEMGSGKPSTNVPWGAHGGVQAAWQVAKKLAGWP